MAELDLPQIHAGDNLETAATARQWQNLSSAVRRLLAIRGAEGSVDQAGDRLVLRLSAALAAPERPFDRFVGVVATNAATGLYCREVRFSNPAPVPLSGTDRFPLRWEGPRFEAFPQYGAAISDYQPMVITDEAPPPVDYQFLRATRREKHWIVQLPAGQASARTIPVVIRQREFDSLAGTIDVQELVIDPTTGGLAFGEVYTVRTWYNSVRLEYAALAYLGDDPLDDYCHVVLAYQFESGEVRVSQAPLRFAFSEPPDPEVNFNDCRVPSRGVIQPS